ncbi:MAG: squalene synthase HpnC [Ectothiorhodospiraceae bacterium]|nr:squalene synthase HpnC [Ectothiorhodospiraceae bacterium]
MPTPDTITSRAYDECLRIARSHYENFPVASWLMPRRLRGPVAAIYAFARRGDDIADEGDAAPERRLEALDALGAGVDRAAAGMPDDDPVMLALADAIPRHRLPVSLFHDLLDAFRQDVTQKRYAHFAEVVQYCRRSANPVGRLLLHLTGNVDERNLGCSDAICTALQLINFYQDLAQDYEENGRIYLPQDEMERFGVTEEHIAQRISDFRLRGLMQHQYQRADRLLRSGAPLGRALKGRFGLEIRLIVMGGARVLWRLRRQDGDLFSRPRLRLPDWLAIVGGALFPR